MGLIDDLAAPPKKASAFESWVLEQTPDIRKALETAAADPRWSTYALTQMLRKHGASCSRESIAPWRAKHGYVAD